MNSQFDEEISTICEKYELNEKTIRKKLEYLSEKQFKFVKFLGKGSFGLVIEAITAKNNKVAIKMINKSEVNSNEVTKEVSVLEKIKNQKYLIQTYESLNCIPLNMYYIVSELCDCSLKCILELNNLSERQVYSITKQLLEGLIEMENLNILHCDIKPENILFSVQKNAFMYADFGLSKTLNSGSKLSKNLASSIGGTYIYIAPELLGLKQDIQHKIDVFSLGVTLAEIIRGKQFDFKEAFDIKEDKLLDYFEKNSPYNNYVDKILMNMARYSKEDRKDPSELLTILTKNFQFDEIELKTLSIVEQQSNQIQKITLNTYENLIQYKDYEDISLDLR